MCSHGEFSAHHGYGWCCCHPEMSGMRGFHRYFSTREERTARLEEYLKDLQKEARAVEEQIAESKGK